MSASLRSCRSRSLTRPHHVPPPPPSAVTARATAGVAPVRAARCAGRSAHSRLQTGTAIAALALLLTACVAQASPDVHDGDILFQTSHSAQSAAIQKATHSPYSHMGLVLHRDGKPYVLEAIGPVKYTPLAEWIARGVGGKCVVKRLRDAHSITPQAVEKLREAARAFEGKPYDIAFGWSDDRIYCSELVWKIYNHALGIEIGQLQPLRTLDLSDPIVRAKLNERYGEKLPLDEPVITPAAMFDAGRLETVATR